MGEGVGRGNPKLEQAEKLNLGLFLSATATLFVATFIVAAWVNTLKAGGHPTSRRVSPTLESHQHFAGQHHFAHQLPFSISSYLNSGNVAVAVLIPHPDPGRVPSHSQLRGLLPFDHDRRFVFIHSFGDSAIQLSSNCPVNRHLYQIHRPTRK